MAADFLGTVRGVPLLLELLLLLPPYDEDAVLSRDKSDRDGIPLDGEDVSRGLGVRAEEAELEDV